MFSVTPKPEFTHKVAVLVPVDGGHKEETLMARFRVIASERWTELATTSYTDVLEEIVVSFEDLVDAAGQPLAYNDEVRAAVLGLPYVRTALLRTYNEAVTKARLGN